jgi:hypothetical protein
MASIEPLTGEAEKRARAAHAAQIAVPKLSAEEEQNIRRLVEPRKLVFRPQDDTPMLQQERMRWTPHGRVPF